MNAREFVFNLRTLRDHIIAAIIEIRHRLSEHARDEILVTLIHFILDYAQFIFLTWDLIEINIEGALRVFILVSFYLILVFLHKLLLLAAIFHNVVLMFLLINTINNLHVIKFVSDRLVMRD